MVRCIKVIVVLAFLCCSAGLSYAGRIVNTIVIPFGKQSKLVYHTNQGSYDVYVSGQKIISSAFSVVKNLDHEISSKDYTLTTKKETVLKDNIGAGKKYTITLSKKGLPDMEQVFYTYPNVDYFLTEVILKGTNLKSNYMAPLVSESVNLYAKGDNRSLFVPFDNDAFVRYDARPMDKQIENSSSEVAAFYDNDSRKGLIIGSVEHMIWKTGIKSIGFQDQLSSLSVFGGYSEEKVTRDKGIHGSINGSLLKSPKIFVGYFQDWRKGLDAYGQTNRKLETPYVFNWTKPVPFGWNSWGVIQEKLSYEKAIATVDFFTSQLPGFRNGNTAYIDLDSFWDNFTGGMSGDYTRLKQFADYCKSKGLEPGVYWAPFTDWGFKSNGERQVEGSNYKFSEIWTKVKGGYHDFDGGRAIDPTHPGTKKRIDYIIDRLKSCGFKMIKIDFLGHAAIEADSFYDKNTTTGMQAYRTGMEYLVDRMDGQMLIYAAISPGMATGRYAHIRRIACDAWKTMKDTEYTLNSVNYGWWQTHVYNHIDADHVVFATESKGTNRARLISSIITGSIITGDDFTTEGIWQQQAKDLLQNQQLLNISRSGKAFSPVDGNTGDQANALFISTIKGETYLAILNYGTEKRTFKVSLARLGLKNKSVQVVDLISQASSNEKSEITLALDGHDATIIKIKTKL